MAVLKQGWARVTLALWAIASLSSWLLVGGLISIPAVGEAINYVAYQFLMRWLEAQMVVLAVSMAMGLMVGLSAGLLQWLMLRVRLQGAGWWILASLLGFGIFPRLLTDRIKPWTATLVTKMGQPTFTK